MPRYQIFYTELNTLVYCARQYGLHYPKRWHLISDIVKKVSHNSSPQPTVTVGSGTKLKIFDSTYTDCRLLFNLLEKEHPELLVDPRDVWREFVLSNGERNGHKPIYLMGETSTCMKCGRDVHLQPRASFPVVYTVRGATIAAAFHSHCQPCQLAHHYSYTVSGDGQIHFQDIADGREYFQVSSQTVFETELLVQVRLLMCTA